MKKERFLLPLLLILIWQGLSSIQVIPSYKLPSPVEIVLGFKDLLIDWSTARASSPQSYDL